MYGHLVQWHDSRLGCERSRVQFSECPFVRCPIAFVSYYLFYFFLLLLFKTLFLQYIYLSCSDISPSNIYVYSPIIMKYIWILYILEELLLLVMIKHKYAKLLHLGLTSGKLCLLVDSVLVTCMNFMPQPCQLNYISFVVSIELHLCRLSQ